MQVGRYITYMYKIKKRFNKYLAVDNNLIPDIIVLFKKKFHSSPSNISRTRPLEYLNQLVINQNKFLKNLGKKFDHPT